jgi:hypothetical protein
MRKNEELLGKGQERICAARNSFVCGIQESLLRKCTHEMQQKYTVHAKIFRSAQSAKCGTGFGVYQLLKTPVQFPANRTPVRPRRPSPPPYPGSYRIVIPAPARLSVARSHKIFRAGPLYPRTHPHAMISTPRAV